MIDFHLGRHRLGQLLVQHSCLVERPGERREAIGHVEQVGDPCIAMLPRKPTAPRLSRSAPLEPGTRPR